MAERSEFVSARLTKHERDMLEGASEVEGKSASEFIRSAITEKIAKVLNLLQGASQ